jgi:hypothetical protein
VENDPKPEKKVDTVSIEKLLKKVQLKRKSRECKKSNESSPCQGRRFDQKIKILDFIRKKIS